MNTYCFHSIDISEERKTQSEYAFFYVAHEMSIFRGTILILFTSIPAYSVYQLWPMLCLWVIVIELCATYFTLKVNYFIWCKSTALYLYKLKQLLINNLIRLKLWKMNASTAKLQMRCSS